MPKGGCMETKIDNLVDLTCIVCGQPFRGEEPKMCCDGRECGCMGLPIDPVVCSEWCYQHGFKPLTKGTTREQWYRYYTDLKAHEERVAREKPIEPDHMEYKEQKFKGEWTFKPGALERYSNDWDAYQKKLSAWEMMRSCDAPNEPGYYRANND